MAADSSWSRPTLRAVAASSTSPACEITRFAVVSRFSDGCKPGDFRIGKVLLFVVNLDQIPSQAGVLFSMINSVAAQLCIKGRPNGRLTGVPHFAEACDYSRGQCIGHW
jgi:hypothetical protein